MALKYAYRRAVVDLVPPSEVTATVDFMIRNDRGEGKFKTGIEDQVQFTPTFPLTKASLRTEADAAITAKYQGATPA